MEIITSETIKRIISHITDINILMKVIWGQRIENSIDPEDISQILRRLAPDAPNETTAGTTIEQDTKNLLGYFHTQLEIERANDVSNKYSCSLNKHSPTLKQTRLSLEAACKLQSLLDSGQITQADREPVEQAIKKAQQDYNQSHAECSNLCNYVILTSSLTLILTVLKFAIDNFNRSSNEYDTGPDQPAPATLIQIIALSTALNCTGLFFAGIAGWHLGENRARYQRTADYVKQQADRYREEAEPNAAQVAADPPAHEMEQMEAGVLPARNTPQGETEMAADQEPTSWGQWFSQGCSSLFSCCSSRRQTNGVMDRQGLTEPLMPASPG